MYCRHCGEKNPDKAKFCKNCGTKLKEEIKKVEVIEKTTTNQNTSTHNSSNSDESNWMNCCLCLIGIFIVGAIMSALGL